MNTNSTFNDSLAFSINRTDMILRRRFNGFLNPFEVTQEQYAVLTALSEQPGLTQCKIVNILDKGYSSVSRICHGLHEKCLIETKHIQADRRTFRIYLTRRGKALINLLGDKTSEFRNQQFGALTVKEQKMLLRLLNKVLDTSNKMLE